MLRILSVALGISVAVAGILYYKKAQRQAFVAVQEIQPISDFTLTDHHGESFQSSELEGQVWVTHFMFTTCQGPCPLMTKKITKLKDELKESHPFHLVSITMNPDADDEAALTEYSQRFGGDDNWSLLFGPIESVIDIARQVFRVPADKDPNLHSTLFVLMNKELKIHGYYDSQDPERMAELKQAIQDLNSQSSKDDLS